MGLYEAYLFLKHLAALQRKSTAVVPELVALGDQAGFLSSATESPRQYNWQS